MPNCGIEIVRGMPGPKERHGKLVLFINGRVVEASQKQVTLLACLYDNLGHVIPYERLGLTLGHKLAGNRQRHLIQQYAYWIKKTLAEYQTPCVLTAADRVGYALCEIAQG